MLKRDSLDTHVELTDLLALKLAAAPAEKLRSEIPAGLLVNVARQFEIIGTPSGSSRNVSVASLMPLRKTSTAVRSSWRSNFRLLMAASFS